DDHWICLCLQRGIGPHGRGRRPSERCWQRFCPRRCGPRRCGPRRCGPLRRGWVSGCGAESVGRAARGRRGEDWVGGRGGGRGMGWGRMGRGLGYGSCIRSGLVIVLLRSVLRLQLRLLWLQWLLSGVIRWLGWLGWWLARVPDALLPAGMVVSRIA